MLYFKKTRCLCLSNFSTSPKSKFFGSLNGELIILCFYKIFVLLDFDEQVGRHYHLKTSFQRVFSDEEGERIEKISFLGRQNFLFLGK